MVSTSSLPQSAMNADAPQTRLNRRRRGFSSVIPIARITPRLFGQHPSLDH
jgi:hypothetical protein